MRLVQIGPSEYVNPDHVQTAQLGPDTAYLQMADGRQAFVESMFMGNIWLLIAPGPKPQ